MPIPSLDPSTATFRAWMNTTNTMINTLNSNTVVAGVNAAGQFAIGSATDLQSSLTIAGSKLTVNGSLLSISTPTVVSSNLAVSGAGVITTLAGANVVMQPSVSTRIASPALDVSANATFSSKGTFSGNVEFLGATTRVTAGQLIISSPTTTLMNVVSINTATIANLTLSGPIALSSTLSVAGPATLNGALTLVGSATLRSTLAVNGAATFNNTLTVIGSTSGFSNVTISGSLITSGQAFFNSDLSVSGLTSLRTLSVQGAASFTAGMSGSGAGLTSLNASALATGTVPIARLAVDGVPSPSSFLAGDGVWRVPTVVSAIPVGAIIMTARPTADVGYMLCDGRLVSKSTFPELYSALGTTYGPETSTQFRLPNLQQRFPLGASVTIDAATNLAATGGSFDHTHTYTQVPAHTHAITDPGHTHPSGDFSTTTIYNGTESAVNNVALLNGGASVAANTTGITINSTGVASPQTQAANPPYIVINFQIKY